jgi:zinc/manganese transport system substrate-binding protein/zinc transport system substrate-binding protein
LPDAEGHLGRKTLNGMARALRAAALAAWCALATAALAQDHVEVITTTTDLRSLTQAVGGERVTVTSLVPAGMDAEEYQPKPQDALRLTSARLFVRAGLDYDLWADRLLLATANGAIRRGRPGYVDASYGIATLEVRGMSVGPGDGHAHGNGNPHYWLDPHNAEIITATILAGLSRIDPEHADIYEANRAAFVARLNEKLAGWEEKLAPFRGMALVGYHNSWPYFARRFRLDFVGFIEVKPGVPPSPSHLAGIVQLIRERGVKVVVREPHEPQRDVAFVAGRAGAKIATLAGSVGALPQAADYIALFDANVEALTAAAQ